MIATGVADRSRDAFEGGRVASSASGFELTL
jgi:hypothetical protein